MFNEFSTQNHRFFLKVQYFLFIADENISFAPFSKFKQKSLTAVGFEPTPGIPDQNAHALSIFQLESGALDRSATLSLHK